MSYFWVFKKSEKNEQILIRRLGRLHSSKSGTVAKLPIIDTETRADMSVQKTILTQKELFTFDKVRDFGYYNINKRAIRA